MRRIRPFRLAMLLAIAAAASDCASAPNGLALRPGIGAAEHRRDAEAVCLFSAYLAQDNLPAEDAKQAIGTLITIHLAHDDYDKTARAGFLRAVCVLHDRLRQDDDSLRAEAISPEAALVSEAEGVLAAFDREWPAG